MIEFDKVAGAFLGAACGDALGWPFEGHAKKRPDLRSWRGNFESWFKISGGRFRPSTEYIAKGEYSDDTQLIIALSRSIIKVDYWWLYFALVELPFWTVYERGGGGATKRAATNWLSGVPPWHAKPDQIKSYLSAGGNGVAMRVLPHCIYWSESFEEVGKNIVTDGVITHGHPRALVGGLAYGYILWRLLRKTGTLEFGEMVEDLLSSADSWGSEKHLSHYWPDWQSTVTSYDPTYVELWNRTVEEMLQLLHIVKDALAEGALATDKSALERLGALSAKTNGAGTVTCAAAVYFASRYAASPLEGLVLSASSIGADTDTLSSMTGGLLGALTGQQWLQGYSSDLQDVKYILKIAEEIRRANHRPKESEIREIGKSDLSKFVENLSKSQVLTGTSLPNGEGIKRYIDVSEFRGPQNSRKIWEVESENGQNFFIRGAYKLKSSEKAISSQPQIHAVLNVGVSLAVENIHRSREFYENILGMTVAAATPKTLRFDNNLVFQKTDVKHNDPSSITLFIQVAHLEATLWELKRRGIDRLGEIQLKGNARAFEVKDPDGYILELFERT